MARFGKKPYRLPAGVKLEVRTDSFQVEGKEGKLSFPLFPGITIKVEGDVATVENHSSNPKNKALHGLVRSQLANMAEGVTNLWSRQLVIEGVGYSAKIQGTKLVLQIGFCHPVEMPFPEGVTAECSSNTSILVKGMDKQAVGQYAANIRRVRPPEPYKGKGIRYADEIVRRKPGKTLTSA
jgi:large subunit ribosomal protein L6